MPSRPPRPTNSDAGPQVEREEREARGGEAREHAGQAVLVRERGDREQRGAGGQPDPGGEPVGVAEAVDRLRDHDDEQRTRRARRTRRRRWARSARPPAPRPARPRPDRDDGQRGRRGRSARSRRPTTASTSGTERDHERSRSPNVGRERRGRSAGPSAISAPARRRVAAAGRRRRGSAVARRRSCSRRYGGEPEHAGDCADEQHDRRNDAATTGCAAVDGEPPRPSASGHARCGLGGLAASASRTLAAGRRGPIDGARPDARGRAAPHARRRGRPSTASRSRSSSAPRERVGPERRPARCCAAGSPVLGGTGSRRDRSAVSASFSPGRRPVTLISMSSCGRSPHSRIMRSASA